MTDQPTDDTALYSRIDTILQNLEREDEPPAQQPQPVQEPLTQQIYNNLPSMPQMFNPPSVQQDVDLDAMRNNHRLKNVIDDIQSQQQMKRDKELKLQKKEEKNLLSNNYGILSLVVVSLGVVMKILHTGINVTKQYKEQSNLPNF
jgi:hypothetical protein